MSGQPDLFVPPMPDDLAKALDEARANLRTIAATIDTKLEAFFRDAWTECHQRFTDTREDKDGKPKTTEYWGTPDFNGFDRITGSYERAVSKVRWMLWNDVNDRARESRDG